MIALEPSTEQREAVDAPLEECVAILGAAGSGKSTALGQRVQRANALHADASPLRFDDAQGLAEFAVAVLREMGRSVTLVDDVEAELLFGQACAPLLALRWEEFAAGLLDPEVPGLRSPERFLASAFRLIRRLGDAAIAPPRFLSLALAGATEFYANPPNFADARLLVATKATYHDSLDIGAPELARQHRREVDLAKILAKLYADYLAAVSEGGRMTGRDAVAAAAQGLRDDPAHAQRLRERHRFAFVDDAQELTECELGLLRAVFGETLGGVTLCGDPESAVSTLRRTNPAAACAYARTRVVLRAQYRTPRIERQRLAAAPEEAAFVAERVREWIDSGVSRERIAVIFRSVGNVEAYEAALLAREVPVARAGDVNLFADRRALDALALLWNVYDPFRHEWLLRTLSGGVLRLSDASLALLCSEPPDPQRSLFALDDEPAPTTRSSRWNPKRDLRLGWNVVRGERDDALSDEARRRLTHFRQLREGWIDLADTVPFETFARTVWREALAREGEEGSARAKSQQLLLSHLLRRLSGFAREHPRAGLAEVLAYAQHRLESELESCEAPSEQEARGFVQLLSVEAARGREFEHVVVANVRPGAFPRWYAPDNFLFSPRYGMVPKENAGGARAARTAKFTYYTFHARTAQHYNERERRAFAYALRRARSSVLVTAWGTPTRGITAPELLEELR